MNKLRYNIFKFLINLDIGIPRKIKQKLLFKIIIKYKYDWKIIILAICKLNNQSLLRKLVAEFRGDIVLCLIISKIVDKVFLEKLITENKDSLSAWRAEEKLNKLLFLEKTAIDSNNRIEQLLSIVKLTNIELLEKLVKGDDNIIRRLAKNRLNKIKKSKIWSEI